MNPYSKPVVETISDELHRLKFKDGRELYLIGTAHVSKASAELVERIIHEVKPDTVCVELDDKRLKAIMKQNSFDDLDIIKIIRTKQLFYFIGQFIMSSFQKKIAQKTGSTPGAEFKRAVELSDETGARLVLSDRDVGITLKRAWRLTGFCDKIKFLGGIVTGGEKELEELNIEGMKNRDAIDNLIKDFGDELPVTKEVLIDERDIYLTSSIQRNLGEKTVAVVGAGHVPGMLKHFESFIPDQKIEEINSVPPPSRVARTVPWIIPAVIIGVFIYGFMFGKRELAGEAILYWILANGTLTAIGCILARAHPLTVVAGFIAAPITSLNPTIGAGFVTALVQSFALKPRVKDFEQMQGGALKVWQWWSNRITIIFLVFILSSIGSSIGTFVALPFLARIFTG